MQAVVNRAVIIQVGITFLTGKRYISKRQLGGISAPCKVCRVSRHSLQGVTCKIKKEWSFLLCYISLIMVLWVSISTPTNKQNYIAVRIVSLVRIFTR
jgi:hypothetical protein